MYIILKVLIVPGGGRWCPARRVDISLSSLRLTALALHSNLGIMPVHHAKLARRCIPRDACSSSFHVPGSLGRLADQSQLQ